MPAMSDAAFAWFVAGTVPLMLAGGLHAIAALVDTVRPTYFAPIDRSVHPEVDRTGIRLVGRARPSMWRVWLGIHISHGVGVLTFGLLCLLVASHDRALIEDIGALRPLTVAFPAIYLVLSLRFWFWGPVIITGTATACFAISAALS